MDDQKQFRAYMKAAASGLEGPPGPCLGDDELTAHYRGGLNAGTRDRVESHLMQCAPCRERLRDLADFMDEPRPGEESAPAADVSREWSALQRRIGMRAVAPRPAAPRWMLAMAACLVVALAVSAMWSVRLAGEQTALERRLREVELQRDATQQQLAAMRRPQLNTPIHDVFPSDAIARSSGPAAVNRITVTPGSPFTVILNGHGVPNLPDYAIEILDAQGRSVWKGEGLRRGALGNFVITMPGDFLVPGEYRFRLSARGERLAEYPVVIVPR